MRRDDDDDDDDDGGDGVCIVRVLDTEWCVSKLVIIHLSAHSTSSRPTTRSMAPLNRNSSFGESRLK